MKKDYIGNQHKYIIPEWSHAEINDLSFEIFCEDFIFGEADHTKTLFDTLFKPHPVPITPSQTMKLEELVRTNTPQFCGIYFSLLFHTCLSLYDDFYFLEKQLNEITHEYQRIFKKVEEHSQVPLDASDIFKVSDHFKTFSEATCLAYHYYLKKKVEEFLSMMSFYFLDIHRFYWNQLLSLPSLCFNKSDHPLLTILMKYYLVLLLEGNENIDLMTFKRMKEEVFLLFNEFIPLFNDISNESPIIALFTFYIRNYSKSNLFTSDELIELYLRSAQKVKGFADISSIDETAFSYWYTLLFHLGIIIEEELELHDQIKNQLLEIRDHTIEDLYFLCYNRVLTNIKSSSSNSSNTSNSAMNEKDYDCWVTFLFTLDDYINKISFNKSMILAKKEEVVRCLQENFDCYDKKVVVGLMKRLYQD